MVVLVTNDDGYKTEGLHTLYRAAKKVFGPEVMVVSPDKLQSSSGMSFTFHKPLRVEKITYIYHVNVFWESLCLYAF